MSLKGWSVLGMTLMFLTSVLGYNVTALSFLQYRAVRVDLLTNIFLWKYFPCSCASACPKPSMTISSGTQLTHMISSNLWLLPLPQKGSISFVISALEAREHKASYPFTLNFTSPFTFSLDIAHLPEDTEFIPGLPSSCSPYNLLSPTISCSCFGLWISMN